MTVLNLQVGAGTDDAFQFGNGVMDLVGFNIYFGHVSIARNAGFRFTGVSGLSGASIDAATLTFRASSNDTGSFIGDWYAHDTAAPGTFTSTAYNITDVAQRPRTTATCEGDGNDFGSWTGGQDETFDGPAPGIKGILQELADDYDPSEIALLWIYTSGSGERVLTSYNGSPSLATKLDITYTAGGPPPVTGQVDLAGVGSLAAVAGVTIPAAVALSGVGALAAAGTIGVTHEAAAVLSGVGTLTPGTPIMTLVGQASMLGEGSLVAVGERGALGQVALDGIGSLAAVGEVGIEGRAALAGVGSMSVLAQRIIPGQVVLAGVGTLVGAGVVTVVGVAALTGVGALAAIGETGEILYTVFGAIRREVDPNDYPAGTQFFYEAVIAVGSFEGTARTRLFNITDAVEVADSVLTRSGFGGAWLRSPALSLPNSPKFYRAEWGGAVGGNYLIFSADIRTESD